MRIRKSCPNEDKRFFRIYYFRLSSRMLEEQQVRLWGSTERNPYGGLASTTFLLGPAQGSSRYSPSVCSPHKSGSFPWTFSTRISYPTVQVATKVKPQLQHSSNREGGKLHMSQFWTKAGLRGRTRNMLIFIETQKSQRYSLVGIRLKS